MTWAQEHIAKLLKGETVSFRPRGKSMEPQIKSGELCTLVPVRGVTPQVFICKDDIVLCKVHGQVFLHKVLAVKTNATMTEINQAVKAGEWPNDQCEFQIGNNKEYINGWTKGTHIYGKLINIEP